MQSNGRIFGPGDTIRISVGIRHTMHIDSVTVVFAHERQEGVELQLFGGPAPFEEGGRTYTVAEVWRSEAEVVATVPANTTPGRYALSQVLLETYGGRVYRYEAEELGEAAGSLGFEVVEEPADRPVIEGLGYT